MGRELTTDRRRANRIILLAIFRRGEEFCEILSPRTRAIRIFACRLRSERSAATELGCAAEGQGLVHRPLQPPRGVGVLCYFEEPRTPLALAAETVAAVLLRIVIAIGMTVFCVWQAVVAASVPTEAGRHYVPILYFLVPVLLWGGLNRSGMLTWPMATVLLLVRAHWIVGWIPVALVIFNLIGNEVVRNRRTG